MESTIPPPLAAQNAPSHAFTRNGLIPYEIHIIGDPKTAGGDGRRWFCGCAAGNPTAKGYPCTHISDLWGSAKKERALSRHFTPTPYGETWRQACHCAGEEGPIELERLPPPQPPPRFEGPPRNQPCPCGSGYNFKRCHLLNPWERPPEAGEMPPEAPPPPPPAEVLEAQKETKRAGKRIAKVLAREERFAKLDKILGEIHRKDAERAEARKERDRKYREKKKQERKATT